MFRSRVSEKNLFAKKKLRYRPVVGLAPYMKKIMQKLGSCKNVKNHRTHGVSVSVDTVPQDPEKNSM